MPRRAHCTPVTQLSHNLGTAGPNRHRFATGTVAGKDEEIKSPTPAPSDRVPVPSRPKEDFYSAGGEDRTPVAVAPPAADGAAGTEVRAEAGDRTRPGEDFARTAFGRIRAATFRTAAACAARVAFFSSRLSALMALRASFATFFACLNFLRAALNSSLASRAARRFSSVRFRASAIWRARFLTAASRSIRALFGGRPFIVFFAFRRCFARPGKIDAKLGPPDVFRQPF
jgi:hypothetical protein